MPPIIMPTIREQRLRWPRVVLLCVLVTGVLGWPESGLGQEPEWWSVTLPDLNRTYEQPDTDLGPQKVGPLTLRLQSPENRLRVVRHRARLKPLDDGTHRVRLRVEFEGGGDLVATMESGETPTRFEDELEVPLQEISLKGRIGLERKPEGILVTLHELPRTVRVRFESRLGAQVTALCEQLAVLFLGATDCSGIDALFSAADAPLPEPGTSYLLTQQYLGAEGLTLLDMYLSRQLDRQEDPIR